MAGLFLVCRLCGRKQADGILSRTAWGHIELADGTTASACPACKAEDSDWQQRVGAGGAARYGASYRS